MKIFLKPRAQNQNTANKDNILYIARDLKGEEDRRKKGRGKTSGVAL